MSEKVIEVTDRNWDAEVVQSDVPVLVDLWAPWCAPCKMVTPIMESLAEENEGRLKVCKLNVDENPSVASKFGINAIPTVLVIENGEEVDRHIGVQPKATYRSAVEKVAGS